MWKTVLFLVFLVLEGVKKLRKMLLENSLVFLGVLEGQTRMLLFQGKGCGKRIFQFSVVFD